MSRKVRIYGWKKGAGAVSAIRVLVEGSSIGLSEAKRGIERVLDGGVIEVMPRGDASALVALLGECGFDAVLSGE